QPGITDAQARALVAAQVEIEPDHWLPLSLFVIDDFADMRIEKITRVSGAWPPPRGTLLVEQTAVAVLPPSAGSRLAVQPPGGRTSVVEVAGVASDRALAPAWQEQRGYAYITPETLEWLGEPPMLDQLKIAVPDQVRFEAGAIERTSRQLGAWL